MDADSRFPLSVPQVRRVLYAASFLRWFGVGLPSSLLVLWLQGRGANLEQVGLLLGAHALVVIVLEVPSGALADTLGRKRTALLAHVTSLAGMLATVTAESFLALLGVVALLGAGRALVSGALDAWFVDALLWHDATQDLQPDLARVGSLSIAGLAVGAIVGASIPGLVTDVGWVAAWGLSPLTVPFLASAGVEVLTILVIAWFVVEVPREAKREVGLVRGVGSVLRDAVQGVRGDGVFAWLLLISVAGGVGVSSLETFWQPHFAGLLAVDVTGGETLVFGMLMAGAFAAAFLGNLASIPLGRWFARRYALVGAALQGVAGVALVLLAWQAQPVLAVAWYALTYLAHAGTGSPASTILHARIPSERRSASLSIISLASFIGAFLGSAGLGWVAERVGIGVAWSVAGGVMGFAVLAWWRVHVRVGQVAGAAAEEPSSI